MESTSRDLRSLNPQESVPFLGATNNDYDVELQSLPQQNDDHHSHYLQDQALDVSPNDSREDHTIYDEPSLLVLEGRRPRTLLRYLLSCAQLRSGRRSSSVRRRSYTRAESRCIRPLTALWRTVVVLLMLLGLVQLATLLLGIATAFFPGTLDHAFRTWRSQEKIDSGSQWPTDYTADIHPVACHSHNDYWRRIPLRSAIKAGCTGVEADVWLIEGDLYVGHAESALSADRTFSTLYINPLVEILERQNPITEFQPFHKIPRNGVFDTDHSQTLILLIDFKTSYEELWPVVSSQLEPLRQRQYLTHFNGTTVVQGPITVVVTGNAAFDYVVSDMHYRDMFFDAPLDMLASLSDSEPNLSYDPAVELEYQASFNASPNKTVIDHNQGQGHSGHPPTNPAIFMLANSYYASVDFKASIGWPQPYLSPAQRDKIAAQVAGAHSRGLKVRYWGVPNWPIGLRNYMWRELVKMGIDYLNVDDLHSATQGDWRSGNSIWDWSLWGGKDW